MARSALLTVLLATTALAIPLTQAHAQSQTPDQGSSKPAAQPAPDAPIPSRTTAAEVIVHALNPKSLGGGLIKAQVESKSISTVSSAYIQTQPAIQNAYQYVQLTPGALVSTTDPYGLSEQGSINVHGLGQDELGYVLEGMPLNDIGYYTAYPSQFIDSENIDEISLAQGTADLDSPVISATGGLMTITILDPSLSPGGLAEAAYGSYDTYRGFLRLDSGLIGNTGFRAFISYSYTHSGDWHGPGFVKRQHIDYKVVKEWANGSRFTLSGTYHDGITPTYQEPTLSEFQQNGVNNNFSNTFTPGSGDYWKLNVGTFRILYMTAPSKWVASPNVTVNLTPYWQYGYGNSPYGTSLTEDGNYEGTAGPYTINIPNYAETGGTVMANFQDLQYREGLVAKTTYSTGPNNFIVGFWIDHSDETDTESYSAVSANGTPANLWVFNEQGTLKLPDGALFLAGGDRVLTTVFEPFVGDILHLLDNRLTIEAGFKEAWVWRSGTNEAPGPQTKVAIDDIEPLPRIAARYKLDDHNEVFANVSTNFRTPSEQTMFDTYYGGSLYGSVNANLKPEYSVSEDLGYRYKGPLGNASITVFNYNFSNRQIATVVGGNLISESVNAGSQTTNGIDAEWGGHRWYHISPYVSGEYLHSVDNSDLLVGDSALGVNTYLPTAGKTAVRSPKFQGALGLSYDDGVFFGDFNVKAVSSQYSTFMDDEKIPGYATTNLALGARLPSTGFKTRPEIKLNIVNLTGLNYLAAVASPTSNANPVVARDGSMISGASPTYYVSGGRAAMVTLTQAF